MALLPPLQLHEFDIPPKNTQLFSTFFLKQSTLFHPTGVFSYNNWQSGSSAVPGNKNRLPFKTSCYCLGNGYEVIKIQTGRVIHRSVYGKTEDRVCCVRVRTCVCVCICLPFRSLGSTVSICSESTYVQLSIEVCSVHVSFLICISDPRMKSFILEYEIAGLEN